MPLALLAFRAGLPTARTGSWELSGDLGRGAGAAPLDGVRLAGVSCPFSSKARGAGHCHTGSTERAEAGGTVRGPGTGPGTAMAQQQFPLPPVLQGDLRQLNHLSPFVSKTRINLSCKWGVCGAGRWVLGYRALYRLEYAKKSSPTHPGWDNPCLVELIDFTFLCLSFPSVQLGYHHPRTLLVSLMISLSGALRALRCSKPKKEFSLWDRIIH